VEQCACAMHGVAAQVARWLDKMGVAKAALAEIAEMAAATAADPVLSVHARTPTPFVGEGNALLRVCRVKPSTLLTPEQQVHPWLFTTFELSNELIPDDRLQRIQPNLAADMAMGGARWLLLDVSSLPPDVLPLLDFPVGDPGVFFSRDVARALQALVFQGADMATFKAKFRELAPDVAKYLAGTHQVPGRRDLGDVPNSRTGSKMCFHIAMGAMHMARHQQGVPAHRGTFPKRDNDVQQVST
jgi:hypothetical protein